jgi:3,4-dihydroxy 2-butanone 4-phosphate synthase/GTP cyclohydrolase II
MATEGRGLICLPLTATKLQELGLPMMVTENTTPLGTAFTVSIDARRGIATGVSASDRAKTILAAVATARVRTTSGPGPRIPVARARRRRARAYRSDGGAVDLARLAASSRRRDLRDHEGGRHMARLPISAASRRSGT